MNPSRLDAEDQRNSSFGPGQPEMVEHRPGFLDDTQKRRDIPGEERFPRKSKESEVPRESLASRIRQSGKGA